MCQLRSALQTVVSSQLSTPNSPLGSGRSRISARNTLARKPGSQATTQQARLLIRILTPGVQEFNEFQSKFNFQCRRTQLQTSNHKLMKLLMNDIHLNWARTGCRPVGQSSPRRPMCVTVALCCDIHRQSQTAPTLLPRCGTLRQLRYNVYRACR